MKFTTALWLRSVIATTALLGWGGAEAQQASFAVAITLHAASKPLNAAQLCQKGKPTPTEVLGVAIRVDCPKETNATATNVVGGGANSPPPAGRAPEVTVTF